MVFAFKLMTNAKITMNKEPALNAIKDIFYVKESAAWLILHVKPIMIMEPAAAVIQVTFFIRIIVLLFLS